LCDLFFLNPIAEKQRHFVRSLRDSSLRSTRAELHLRAPCAVDLCLTECDDARRSPSGLALAWRIRIVARRPTLP
jgi:hypothetical protein